MEQRGEDKVSASLLSGVSETALLTLYGRAHQARHPRAIIRDPMAIRLVDAIDFDFDKFGCKGQEMALRSLAFDKAAIPYLETHPSATVVALAEGLQTLTDNGSVYTSRFTHGHNDFERLLTSLAITQKNGRPGHPQTQGKSNASTEPSNCG